MTPDQSTSWRWFVWGCLFEGSLALLAAGLGRFTGVDWEKQLHFEAGALGWGALAALPMLALFETVHRSSWEPFRAVRRILDRHLRPILAPWSAWQLGVISLLAGVGEEALFRGALQGSLEPRLGVGGALLVASVTFGLGHSLSPAYAWLATLMGLFLGLLWWSTGGLIAPVTAHAVYNFVALLLFLRGRPAEAAADDAMDRSGDDEP